MGVTLKQIAELAGVHKSTVDKVIHDRPGVSDAKRQEIKALLKEYEYESNPLAKALNYQKKKMTIAVVLPIVDALPELKRGMEFVRQDFNSFNFNLEYYEIPYPNAQEQADCLKKLAKAGVSGVVVSPMESEAVKEAMRLLEQAKIPVVTVNTDLEDAPRLGFVGQDEEQSGKVAARLAGLFLGGEGVIGIFTSRNKLRSVQHRESAFWRHLSEQEPNIQIVETVDTQEDPAVAYRSAAELLSRYPMLNAIMITCGCVPDICRAVRDCHMDHEITILCHEQYPAIVQLVQNGEIACAISGQLGLQGRLVMRMLFEYIIYDKIPEKREIYTKSEILIRENIG